MRPLVTMKAAIVGCGDRVLCEHNGAVVFRRVAGNYECKDMGRTLTRIAYDDESELVIPKDAKLLVVMWGAE